MSAGDAVVLGRFDVPSQSPVGVGGGPWPYDRTPAVVGWSSPSKALVGGGFGPGARAGAFLDTTARRFDDGDIAIPGEVFRPAPRPQSDYPSPSQPVVMSVGGARYAL